MAEHDDVKSSLMHVRPNLEIDKLFRACVKLEASDLHLKVGNAPMVRVDGSLRPMQRGPDRRRGDGTALLPADERSEPQDIRA